MTCVIHEASISISGIISYDKLFFNVCTFKKNIYYVIAISSRSNLPYLSCLY